MSRIRIFCAIANRRPLLLDDLGDHARTDGAAALADGEAQTLIHGDRLNQLDFRYSVPLPTGGRTHVELTLDILNLLNLLNRDWGLVREASAREPLDLLSITEWDATANRPRYTLPDFLPSRDPVVLDASRWRIQLGARYRLW